MTKLPAESEDLERRERTLKAKEKIHDEAFLFGCSPQLMAYLNRLEERIGKLESGARVKEASNDQA